MFSLHLFGTFRPMLFPTIASYYPLVVCGLILDYFLTTHVARPP